MSPLSRLHFCIEPLEARMGPAGAGGLTGITPVLHVSSSGQAAPRDHGGAIALAEERALLLLDPMLTISAVGMKATFIDVDGDKVTVKTTIGKLTAPLFDLRMEGQGGQLQKLTLTDPSF